MIAEIPGYPLYYATRCGKVLTGRWKKGAIKPLKLFLGSNGYWRANVCLPCGKADPREVHLLVAMAFLGDQRSDELVVAHKNDDKNNCSLENLEWVSHKTNRAQAAVNKRVRFRGKGKLHPMRGNMGAIIAEAQERKISRTQLAKEMVVGLTELRRAAAAVGLSEEWKNWR